MRKTYFGKPRAPDPGKTTRVCSFKESRRKRSTSSSRQSPWSLLGIISCSIGAPFCAVADCHFREGAAVPCKKQDATVKCLGLLLLPVSVARALFLRLWCPQRWSFSFNFQSIPLAFWREDRAAVCLGTFGKPNGQQWRIVTRFVSFGTMCMNQLVPSKVQ